MIKVCIAFIVLILLKKYDVFLLPNNFLMNLTNSQLVQYLADGYRVNEISEETGINKRAIEKRIFVLMKSALCKTRTQLAVNYIRKKIIE